MGPMLRGVENVIDTAISWPAPRSVGPYETIALEIAFESTRVHFIEIRGMRIHVANHYGGCVFRS